MITAPEIPITVLAVFWQAPAEPPPPTARVWTRMLRRPDELSYRGMIMGIVHYQPDPAKAQR